MHKLNFFYRRQQIFVPSLAGFTLIELLVAISIMVILTTLIVVNFAGLRIPQKLRIAENELVTNIKKIQNYSLSSRVINGSQAVQYYLLKIDLNKPDQYTIQAMYNVTSAPVLADNVETINLPQGIRFSPTNPVVVTRPIYPASEAPAYPSGCALIIFKLPFAQTLFSNGCATNNWDPNSDDYQKVLNFISNVTSSPGNTVSADSQMDITLSSEDGTLAKTVTVLGLTGAVTFN